MWLPTVEIVGFAFHQASLSCTNHNHQLALDDDTAFLCFVRVSLSCVGTGRVALMKHHHCLALEVRAYLSIRQFFSISQFNQFFGAKENLLLAFAFGRGKEFAQGDIEHRKYPLQGAYRWTHLVRFNLSDGAVREPCLFCKAANAHLVSGSQ